MSGLESSLSKDSYDCHLSSLYETEINITNRVDLTIHYLKYFDCKDTEYEFLETLRDHIVEYCHPKRIIDGAKTSSDFVKLVFEARNKFFNVSELSNSGELGELALFYLLETYLSAPQIVSKMDLKTTSKENYKGSDGIHFGEINGKDCLFYCESKLNKVRSAGLRECIKSVIEFNQDRSKKRHEISIIKSHIEINDQQLRDKIIDYLDFTKPKQEIQEVHACFVGYNWAGFLEVEECDENSELMDCLEEKLQIECDNIKKYLLKNLTNNPEKIRYYFFIIPFKDVEKLRKEFKELLYG